MSPPILISLIDSVTGSGSMSISVSMIVSVSAV